MYYYRDHRFNVARLYIQKSGNIGILLNLKVCRIPIYILRIDQKIKPLALKSQ
ncbi:gp42 [Clostridium phage PhiS63]|uniref:gp42 n=1 Tax=Clostridium phage PhiS63 TaxID=1187894 RepID=UPI00025F77B9|nr:gp42 [Clostridium phage PhiS63]AFJ96097.1 gp42 [Clostridium phage PhiS63]